MGQHSQQNSASYTLPQAANSSFQNHQQHHNIDRSSRERDRDQNNSRHDNHSSLSFDQRKKQYLSNQKQKHVPLLSKNQQYNGSQNSNTNQNPQQQPIKQPFNPSTGTATSQPQSYPQAPVSMQNQMAPPQALPMPLVPQNQLLSGPAPRLYKGPLNLQCLTTRYSLPELASKINRAIQNFEDSEEGRDTCTGRRADDGRWYWNCISNSKTHGSSAATMSQTTTDGGLHAQNQTIS